MGTLPRQRHVGRLGRLGGVASGGGQGRLLGMWASSLQSHGGRSPDNRIDTSIISPRAPPMAATVTGPGSMAIGTCRGTGRGVPVTTPPSTPVGTCQGVPLGGARPGLRTCRGRCVPGGSGRPRTCESPPSFQALQAHRYPLAPAIGLWPIRPAYIDEERLDRLNYLHPSARHSWTICRRRRCKGR